MTTRPGASAFDSIDERRKRVFEMWAHGHSMNEIAQRLNIHTSMVSRDIRIWRKQREAAK